MSGCLAFVTSALDDGDGPQLDCLLRNPGCMAGVYNLAATCRVSSGMLMCASQSPYRIHVQHALRGWAGLSNARACVTSLYDSGASSMTSLGLATRMAIPFVLSLPNTSCDERGSQKCETMR